MGDELASKVPKVAVYTTEFDFFRRGADQAADLYKRNGTLLHHVTLAGWTHSGYVDYTLKKTDVWFADVGRLCKKYLSIEDEPITLRKIIRQKERTFIMLKPDAVQRGLVGKIIERFETKGFKLVAMKLCTPGKEHFEKHYADLASKPFFNGLVEYAASGPVVAMIWEGDNAVLTGRKMLGATKPADSEPGTIRGDFCIDVGRNIIHGSDSLVSAGKEIFLWFPMGTGICNYDNHSHDWLYE
jgi:nucleoside-diphosphate kinase